jgi:hypothetical protein
MIFVVPLLLWWLSLLTLIGEYAVASAAATWFFSHDKAMLESPILRGLTHLVKHHMGTALAGSLLVRLTDPLRDISSFFYSCCSLKAGSEGNCLETLSSDLIAFHAIWGDALYTSGRRVFFLKQRSD